MSHNIEKIIYINLDRRNDRREQIEQELKTMDLYDKAERFQAIDRPKKGIVGCTYSHLAVLKYAKENNWKNVLILEDDFTFLVDKETFETKLQEFFNANIPYDVCMISYHIQREEATNYPFLKKVIEAQTASGYIVHQDFYDKIIELYEYAAPILDKHMQHWIYANDQIWKRLQPQANWYALETRCGKQRSGYSDNSDKFMEYNC